MSAMLIAGSLVFRCSMAVTIDHRAMLVRTSTSPTMVIATSRSDASVYQIFLGRTGVLADHDHGRLTRQRGPKCHRLADRDPSKIVPLPYNI